MMRQRLSTFFTVIAGAAVLAGCASVPTRAGFDDVQALIGARTALRADWNEGTTDDAEPLQPLLSGRLTADAAVQMALLNNPGLQATYEELDIARADLTQAGLLENPEADVSTRFPHLGGGAIVEFSVAQNLLDVFARRSRKKLGAEQFEQAKLRVGDAVLNLAADVRSAYYKLQGAQQVLAMQEIVVQAAEAAAELAQRQQAAGNLGTPDLALQQAALQEVRLHLLQSEAQVLADRENLVRLIGLSGSGASWQIVDALPELPDAELPLDRLEALAASQRLDLAAARQQTRVSERAVSVARLGAVPDVMLGVESEREVGGSWATGPALHVALPIFNRNQGTVASAKAQLRQSRKRLAAKAWEVRAEVRLARDRLLAARRTVEHYQKTLLPLHERIVAESQPYYNYMLLGADALLGAKQDEIAARRGHIEALTDYWIARSDLERAVGGWLAAAEANDQPSPEPPAPSQEIPHHHHHGDEPQ